MLALCEKRRCLGGDIGVVTVEIGRAIAGMKARQLDRYTTLIRSALGGEEISAEAAFAAYTSTIC